MSNTKTKSKKWFCGHCSSSNNIKYIKCKNCKQPYSIKKWKTKNILAWIDKLSNDLNKYNKIYKNFKENEIDGKQLNDMLKPKNNDDLKDLIKNKNDLKLFIDKTNKLIKKMKSTKLRANMKPKISKNIKPIYGDIIYNKNRVKQNELSDEYQKYKLCKKLKKRKDYIQYNIYLFGDNDVDRYRDKKYKDRKYNGGQAKIFGIYDDSVCFGIVTTFYKKSNKGLKDKKFKEFIDDNFEELFRKYIVYGHDIIIPSPNTDDLNDRPHKYFAHNEQIIHHNIGTGIANLKLERLGYIQNKIDMILEAINKDPIIWNERGLVFMSECEFCGDNVPFNLMEHHINSNHNDMKFNPDDIEITCNNCNNIIKGSEYNDHMDICGDKTCDICGESIKLTEYDAHFSECLQTIMGQQININHISNDEAKQMFTQTCSKNDITITDIKTNYEDTYEMALKRICNRTNKARTDLEKLVFHGSSFDTIKKITKNGFDRSYSTAYAYGRGTYFARDASYSASTSYAKPHSDGYQYMLLCKIIVGDCTLGNGGMQRFPLKNDGTEYDCLVNNVQSPSVFVIWRDDRAVPIKLIKFK